MASKFKFGGKEEQDELGLDWYDFHARNYDAALGRWFNLDRKADAAGQIHNSTYSFALNNPIALNDPDGDCPPGINCENVLDDMERVRLNRASNLGAGNTRNNGTKWHAGHDLYAAKESNVNSSMAGEVTNVGTSNSYGNYVTIKTTKTETKFTGFETLPGGVLNPTYKETTKTYYTFYAHLDSTDVEQGDNVTAGQKIGEVGTSGNASNLTGDDVHLHFEIGTELRSTNSPFLKKSKLLDANVGYKDVAFVSQNGDANQSVTGTVRISRAENGNLIFLFQNFNNTTTNGTESERLISQERKDELTNGTQFQQ